MRIGYRRLGRMLKFYLENCTVHYCLCHGNKRIKPERIWNFRKKGFEFTMISKKRYEELKPEMKWFEASEK